MKNNMKINNKILLLSLISFVQFVIVAYLILQSFPNSGDEHSYLYQATLYSDFKVYDESELYNEDNPFYNYYFSVNIADYHGKRFSKYPPGWPLLLAPMCMLGIPQLANPIIGFLLVLLILLYIKRFYGETYIISAWLLLTLTSFFFLNNGSYGSHSSIMLFIFAAYFLYVSSVESKNIRLNIFFVGLLLGFSFLIRWTDFIPLGIWIFYDLYKRKKLKNILYLCIGFVIFASVQLLHNYYISGDITMTPLSIYGAKGLHDKMFMSFKGIWISIQRLGELILVFPPLILAAFINKKQYSILKTKPYILLLIGIFLVYYFYIASLGYSYGPRYLLSYFPFVLLLVINLKTTLNISSDNVRNIVYKTSLILLILVSISFTIYSYYEIYLRKDLFRSIDTISDEKKIILLKSGTYKMSPQDLTRNYPNFYDNKTLIFVYNYSPSINELRKLFIGYNIYIYEYPSKITSYKGS